MARLLPALLACLLALLAWAAPAGAQGIRRCVDASGVSIFTDRDCSEMNAVPMEAPPPPTGNYAGAYRGGFTQRGCARGPEDLLDRVRAALEARDVNRLAGLYHWPGTGSGGGRRIMDRLEAITRQLLLSVELVYPEPPAPPMMPDDPYAAAPRPYDPYDAAPPAPEPYDPDAPASPYPDEPDYIEPEPPERYEAPAAPRPPRQIRVLQMRDAQGEQARSTVFQLRRHAGCWWIQL